MKTREEIIAETFAIAERLPMFGVLKLWWMAKHIQDTERARGAGSKRFRSSPDQLF